MTNDAYPFVRKAFVGWLGTPFSNIFKLLVLEVKSIKFSLVVEGIACDKTPKTMLLPTMRRAVPTDCLRGEWCEDGLKIFALVWHR